MTWINSYFGLRHGESEANVAGRIISAPETGCDQYGLTARGRAQVRTNCEAWRSDRPIDLIVTSDFKRARETAEMAAEVLACKNLRVDSRLRERFFGRYEGGGNSAYEKVWAGDRLNEPEMNGVEPVETVARRLFDLLTDLERKENSRRVLLVSHGDPLQILATALQDRPLSTHREQASWQTAEIRELHEAPDLNG